MSHITWFKIGAAITIIVGGLLMSQPAAALGDREEGVLIGIGSLLILDELAGRDRDVGRIGVFRGNRATRDFPRFRCSSRDAVTCAYERGVWERERELWYKEQAEHIVVGVMESVMSRMGRFVFECQEIAEQSASPARGGREVCRTVC